MISTDFNHLIYQTDNILSYYTSLEVDGFIVQISEMGAINPQNLEPYRDFMLTLQQISGKPAIALKVPIAIGLYLISLGIYGFSCGINSLESFNEANIKDDTDSYNLYARYYFKELLTLITYSRGEHYDISAIYNTLNKCNCNYCKSRDFTEIAAEKDKIVQLHFLNAIKDEIETMNSLETINEKKQYFSARIENAIKNYDLLFKENIIKKNDNYNMIKSIRKLQRE